MIPAGIPVKIVINIHVQQGKHLKKKIQQGFFEDFGFNTWEYDMVYSIIIQMGLNN